MADTPTTSVQDSIAKVDDELAVGEDLTFQRRWWRFEKWAWRFFALIVLCDLVGLFGRGPLANANVHSADHALSIHYERVERFSTPSDLTIRFSAAAVQNGLVRLWVSDSLIERLGNQRISPQPASSSTIDGGILYAFPSGPQPGKVEFALQPAEPGVSHFTVRLVSSGTVQQPQDALTLGVFVMP